MNLSDSALGQHKILLAIIVVALGVTLAIFGIDGTVTFMTGAASGFLAKTIFAVTGTEEEEEAEAATEHGD